MPYLMKKEQERFNLPIVILGNIEELSANNSLKELAIFLGARASILTISKGDFKRTTLERLLPENEFALMVSAPTLIQLEKLSSGQEGLIGTLKKRAKLIFIYGWHDSSDHIGLLRTVADGKIDGMCDIEVPREIVVSGHAIGIQANVVTLSLDDGITLPDKVFDIKCEGKEPINLIGVRTGSIFANMLSDCCEIYLSSQVEIPFLNAPISPWPRLATYFTVILPLIIFIRRAASEDCWRGAASFACITVDDPILVPQYGYLNYQTFFESIRQANVHVSFGFIPWNYLRSNPHVIRIFLDHPDKLSIAYHGCDHTRGEFASRDKSYLASQLQSARNRMNMHQSETGLPCDNVMIFPQHSYSVAAIAALKYAGFHAASTGNVHPDDEQKIVRLKDIMEPALMRILGYPILARTYVNATAEIFLYMILGKPIIICLHQDAFREGYTSLLQCSGFINDICPETGWISLEDIAERCSLMRILKDGSAEVRFYCRRFRLTNPHPYALMLSLQKHEENPDEISQVTLNSNQCEWSWEDGFIHINFVAAPNECYEVEIHYRFQAPQAEKYRNIRYQVAVWARRRMCEYRDRYISRFIHK